MSKRCEITGSRPSTGFNVSHSNRHTKRRWLPNLKKKRLFLADENRWVTMRISTSAIKTLSKKGTKEIEKVRRQLANMSA